MSCFPLEALEKNQGAATSFTSTRGLVPRLLPQVKQIRSIQGGAKLPTHQGGAAPSQLPHLPPPSSFLELNLLGVP